MSKRPTPYLNSRRNFLRHLGLGAVALTLPQMGCATAHRRRDPSSRPNIVYILADDLGYGDAACLNPEGKIPTPKIDQLSRQGMIFTDAHSGSAVCTPTRYGILTGRYSWRSRLQSGVLEGYSPPLIEAGRETVASLLKKQGYATACVGKWHLGWNWQTVDGAPIAVAGSERGKNVDYSKPILDGPRAKGFDYFFGISASLDMDPYVYVENDRVKELPSETAEAGKGYSFYRDGVIATGFRHDQVLPVCTQKAVDFIDRHVASGTKDPFFLYFPLSAPHTPIVPAAEFVGKTGLGPYADFVHQCDFTVGRIMDALDRHGLAENTLFIVTSDNGCSPTANFNHLATLDHDPCHIFRGHKADIFEGGHRIPFIVRWPERVKPGSICNDTVCLTDLMATVAELAGVELPDNAGEDSVSLVPDLLGTAEQPLREATVHHSINGSFSIRQGKWKLELCPGSGGWSEPRPERAAMLGLPLIQLYDLERDIGEQNNLQAQYPDVVHRMIGLLESYVQRGRSTPGKPQPNNGAPDIWKALDLCDRKLKVTRVDHLAKGKKVTLVNDVQFDYSDSGLPGLTNGIRATSYYRDGHWLGVEGEDLEVVIDLEKTCKISKIETGFLQDQDVWIFLPTSVEFSLSLGGKRFQNLKKKVHNKTEHDPRKTVKQFGAAYDQVDARYVKVKVTSLGTCPAWHKGAGGKAWIFVDEIVVV